MRKIVLFAIYISFITAISSSTLLAQKSGFVFAKRAGGTTDTEEGGIAIGDNDNFLVAASIDGDAFIRSYFDDNGDTDWTLTFGGSGSDAAQGIATSGSFTYVSGRFQGTVSFGSFTLSNSGGNDIFVLKLDAFGDVVWAKKAGGSGSDRGVSIAADVNGGVFVAGAFQNTATFGPGESGETSLESNGDDDIFVASFSGFDGDLRWARRAGSTERDLGFGIAVDEDGNSYITGEFRSRADFGSEGNNVEFIDSDGGSRDIFVAKYDDSGNFDWVERIGGSGTDRARGIARFVDPGDDMAGDDHVYVAGRFEGDISVGSESLSSEGGRDILIARFDDDGNVLWAKSAGGSESDEARAVSVSKLANPLDGPGGGPIGPKDVTVQLTGEFRNTVVFGEGEQNEISLVSEGGSDVFIAKFLGDNGKLLWAKQAGGSEDDFGIGVAAASNDDNLLNTFVAGSFSGNPSFGFNSLSSSSVDVFATMIEDFSNPIGLDVEQISDSGLSSFLQITWGAPINASAPGIFVDGIENTGSVCTLGDGTSGQIFNVALDFFDDDLGQDPQINLKSIPSPYGADATLIAGSQSVSGSFINFDVCVRFGLDEAVDLSVTVKDSKGNLSNAEFFTITNPEEGEAPNAPARKMHTKTSLNAGAPGESGGSANLLGYNLYRLNKDTDVEEFVTFLPPEVSSYRDEETEASANYQYKLTALYAEGESEHTGDEEQAGSPSPNKLFELIDTGDIVQDGQNAISSCWGDYNNDGLVDLFVTNRIAENFLYENNGDGTFQKMNQTVGPIVSDESISFSGSWGDFNNDGWLDMFVANSFFGLGKENFLYVNNQGTFTRVTTGAPANDPPDDTNSGVWGDFDNDGNLDLFVANSRGRIAQNNVLYRNQGPSNNYTFSKTVFNDGGRSINAVWADFDVDGDLDLFVANLDENFLYQNMLVETGSATFNRITTGDFATDNGESQGMSFGDYDNDSDLDVFVANDKGVNFLYQNRLAETGTATFQRVNSGDMATDAGFSFGSAWGDYDNDGDLDIYVTNSNTAAYLYENTDGNGNFNRVENGNNVTNKNLGISNGTSWADYNSDGFIDMFVANSQNTNNKNYLYMNNKARGSNSNKSVMISCIGAAEDNPGNTNTSAIGTKVFVKRSGSSKWQMREISGQTGGGFGGQNSLNLAFGLGSSSTVDSIRIEWPSGITFDTTNVSVSQTLSLQFREKVVTDVNNAPIVINPISAQNLTVGGAAFTKNLTTSPAVFNDSDGDALVFSASSNNNGIATASTSGNNLTVNAVSQGTTNITITADDQNGGTVQTNFDVVVVANQDPNIITSIENQTITIGGQPFTQDLTLIFNDPDEDALTFDASSSNDGTATASVSGNTLTVNAVSAGNAQITVSADDGQGGSTSTNFTVTVVANQPPAVSNAIPNQSLTLGEDSFVRDLVADPPVFSDPENDALVFAAASGDPSKVSVAISGSVLTINAVSLGQAQVTIIALDGQGGTVSTSFNVTVVTNQIPVLTSTINDTTITLADGAYTRDLQANPIVFTDPDDDAMTYIAASNNPGVAGASMSGSVLTINPVALGNAVITIIANDNNAGSLATFFTVTVAENATSVTENASIPTEYKLYQNHPNPFNPATTISFSLKKDSNVELKVYNLLGKEVTTLVDGYRHQGNYQINFDASALQTGVYFYVLRTAEFIQTKKMLMLK